MRRRDRARVLGFVGVVVACVPGPMESGTASNGGTVTSSSGGSTGSGSSSGGGTTTMEMVTMGTGTTGGPVVGTWRGFLDSAVFGVPFEIIFSDCVSQEEWGVKMQIPVPEECSWLASPLYVEVAGVLHPPGDEGPWMWSTLEITEVLVGPCREGSCEQGAMGSTCGVWEELCDAYVGCDPWVQDCPDGEKCMPYSGDGSSVWNSLKCVPVMPGAVGAGESCEVEGSAVSGIDNCAEGLMCWGVDPQTGIGTCVPQCTGTPGDPSCPTCSSCFPFGEVFALCLQDCSILEQDCGDGNLCIPAPLDPGHFVCVLDASGDMGAMFDPCEYADACDAGLWCAPPEQASECDPMAAGCCLPFCDVLAPNCPGVGQVCAPWLEMEPACSKYKNVGSCRLAP